MSALPKQTMTEEQYLAFERQSETKHEYFQGELFAMAGASEKHVSIVTSASFHLYRQLRDRPCKVYSTDMRLKVPSIKHYVYPDLIVVCGTPQLTDEHNDTLLNPTVVIEVLSPSTENYDRGLKFQHYRSIESLQEYLLISQDRAQIEHYVRQREQWLLTDANRLETVLELPSIGCQLALAEVYEKVTFEVP